MSKDKEDFLQFSQQFRNEKYGREISIEATKEIIQNLTGFFKYSLIGNTGPKNNILTSWH